MVEKRKKRPSETTASMVQKEPSHQSIEHKYESGREKYKDERFVIFRF